jgi:cell fate (sporulation/competence/biofilm development) regulator YlbF (YheA/YmcA/DUF963 family)
MRRIDRIHSGPIVDQFQLPAAITLHYPMESTTKESPIIQKAMELCQAVAAQPDFQALKSKVDAFMSDEALKFQFQQVNQLNELLEMRQRGGLAIKDEEIAHFESLRQGVLENPVAQGFIEAQQEMQKLHEAIGRFVNKTFELGRSPEYEDVFDGSCGSNCGCH